MKKSIEPKFTGMKKGFSAVFVSDNTSPSNIDRIRVFASNNFTDKQFYCRIDNEPLNIEYQTVTSINYEIKFTPCWVRPIGTSIEDQIKAMIDYDKRDNRETIFLGYVKDVE